MSITVSTDISIHQPTIAKLNYTCFIYSLDWKNMTILSFLGASIQLLEWDILFTRTILSTYLEEWKSKYNGGKSYDGIIRPEVLQNWIKNYGWTVDQKQVLWHCFPKQRESCKTFQIFWKFHKMIFCCVIALYLMMLI